MNKQILKIAFPTAKDETIDKYLGPILETFDRYKIQEKTDKCAFLAQIGHESGNLRYVVENLNYSAERLYKMFSKRFKDLAEAQTYARQPARIASKVYANRMGNGNEESGDGWLYRGRGLIQLTGKANYQKFANHMKMNLDEIVSFLETPKGACYSAGFFWMTNNCNNKTIEQSTRIINGGTNGLDDRRARFIKLLESV